MHECQIITNIYGWAWLLTTLNIYPFLLLLEFGLAWLCIYMAKHIKLAQTQITKFQASSIIICLSASLHMDHFDYYTLLEEDLSTYLSKKTCMKYYTSFINKIKIELLSLSKRRRSSL